MIASGNYKSGYQDMRKMMDSIIATHKNDHSKISIDSTITMMGQRNHFKPGQQFNVEAEVEGDTAVSYVVTQGPANKDPAKKKRFPDPVSAKRYVFLAENHPANNMVEDPFLQQQIKIMPANRGQHIGFIAYNMIVYGCMALDFFLLARLFRNFSKRDYFNLENVSLLKRAGWFLLIPVIAAGLMYWLFLANIHPLKLVMGPGDYTNTTAYYDINAGINWTLVLPGAALLVFGYIFKDAFKLKKKTDSFV